MSTATLSNPQDTLGRGLRLSILAHILVILLALAKGYLFPSRTTPYIPTLRVDIVGLPDVLKKDLKYVIQAPPPAVDKIKDQKTKIAKPSDTEAAKTKEMIAPTESGAKADTKRKATMENAVKRLQALAKITQDSEPVTQVIKGNRVSPGTTLTGDAKEAAEATYFDVVHDILKSNWSLPIWLSRQDLSSQVRIFIGPSGVVENIEVEKVSGNSQFDEAVMQTIRSSQPFPPPPENVQGLVQSDGILLGFPL